MYVLSSIYLWMHSCYERGVAQVRVCFVIDLLAEHQIPMLMWFTQFSLGVNMQHPALIQAGHGFIDS